MKKICLLASILFCVLFTSCLNLDSVQVVGIESVNIKSLSKIDLGIKVDNGSKRDIKIRSVGLDLYSGAKHILSLVINEEIVVPRKSIEIIDVPIHIKMRDPLFAMSIGSNLQRYKTSLNISGDVRVKIGMITKKITLKEMSISQFIDTFGVDFKL